MTNKRIFITGLTGTLGTELARMHHERGDVVLGCSRSEERAQRWLKDHRHLATLYLADAGDLGVPLGVLGFALRSVDRVYHCAAMKHVDLCEANPREALVQNVAITCRIAEACRQIRDESGGSTPELVFVSSDKACLPQSVYGATKLLGERAVITSGGTAVRLGNIIGSSGSVFRKWADGPGTMELTDPDMTRFFVSVTEAARLVADGQDNLGGLVIPNGLKAVRMGDVADRIARPGRSGSHRIIRVGRRPGETQHQWLDVLPDGPEYAWSRSETAPRWDVDELLALAGVTI